MAPFLKFPAVSQTPESLTAAFEAAKDGSVFLDEIVALSSPGQFALLEILEGHDRPRLIAGTYADLRREAGEGRFSPDLFYRLEAAVIRIPPLRERRDDNPPCCFAIMLTLL